MDLLQPNLNRTETLLFVRGCMGNARDAMLSTHAESVAAVVADMAPKYYRSIKGSFLVPAIVDTIDALDHAALMHDMITDYGCTYEVLAGVTNRQVAMLVASQSPDYRLPEPQRYLHRRGGLAQADVANKMLALADIECHAEEFMAQDLDDLTEEQAEQIVRDAAAWYEDLDVLRFTRPGVLRVHKDRSQQLLHGILMKIAANRTARGLRHVIAENIRQRQLANGGASNGQGSDDSAGRGVQTRKRRRSSAK